MVSSPEDYGWSNIPFYHHPDLVPHDYLNHEILLRYFPELLEDKMKEYGCFVRSGFAAATELVYVLYPGQKT